MVPCLRDQDLHPTSLRTWHADVIWAPVVLRAWLGTMRAGTMSGKSLATRAKDRCVKRLAEGCRSNTGNEPWSGASQGQGGRRDIGVAMCPCLQGLISRYSLMNTKQGCSKNLETGGKQTCILLNSCSSLEEAISSFRGLDSLRHWRMRVPLGR